MELFPYSLRKIWNEWEIRALVLLSLYIQVVLVFAAVLRKKNKNMFVTAVIWSCYLLADWVATLALGVLANSQGDSDCGKDKSFVTNNRLLAFWSPFLLLHLGGPDTITAFSLEDNELWLRHFLGLLFQLVVVIYVFIRAEPIKRLKLPCALMFLAGLIKYGERTWALRCASRDNFRDSMIPKPDAGPNYANFMEEYSSKVEAGLIVEIKIQKEPEIQVDPDIVEVKLDELDLLSESYIYFDKFKRLMVDLMLSFHDRSESRAFFLKREPLQAYKVVDTELAFVYDVLFTKAIVVHSVAGVAFRFITLSLSFSTLMAFVFVSKRGYKRIDIVITYILLGGAIFLELFSFGLMILSDWTVIRLKNVNLDRVASWVLNGISVFEPFEEPKWSNTMAQYNLIAYCLEDHWEIIEEVKRLVGYYDYSWEPVSNNFKIFIFKELKEKSRSCQDSETYKRFTSSRGGWALQRRGYRKELGWSIEVELDESILLWHIATDICFNTQDEARDRSPVTLQHQSYSRYMSNYMLYILVVRPSMLSAGIGQIRFRDTCAEAIIFFHRLEKATNRDAKIACKMLLDVETNTRPMDVKGDRSKSVLFNACILAKELLKLKDEETRWALIFNVWVEILAYSSGQCRGLYHAQRLSRGGELLTHVWLVMVHLGIGDQYRIESGHARAKLLVRR